jgi:hypothetical protein
MSWNGVFNSYLWMGINFSASPTIKIKATLTMFIITGVTKNFTTSYRRFSKSETFAVVLGVRPTAIIYADAYDCSKEDF